jgi:hypothetical protein
MWYIDEYAARQTPEILAALSVYLRPAAPGPADSSA